MKPKLSLQLDLFYEENESYLDVIGTHFDIEVVPSCILAVKAEKLHPHFRTSLAIASLKGYKFEFTDCTKWVPHFREEMLSINAVFLDLGYLAKYTFDSDFPLFVRPCSGKKIFAGQVFPTKSKFMEEVNFLQQNKNIGVDLLCMMDSPVAIAHEWRLVYINGKYVSGSQYMTDSEPDVKAYVPQEVIEYGNEIAENSYFKYLSENYVIDIGLRKDTGTLHMIECNSFECSSFYAADLDAIYGTWAK